MCACKCPCKQCLCISDESRVLPPLPQELEGTAQARTWLLLLLRHHARHCQLLYWCTALLPLARRMGALAAAGGNSMRALQCRALEAQLWACLPAFASYPVDLPEAFRSASCRTLLCPG